MVYMEDQESHLTQDLGDAPVGRWGMNLLFMVWGIGSVATREILPPRMNQSQRHCLGCFIQILHQEWQMSEAN